jgi:hypothetical protein
MSFSLKNAISAAIVKLLRPLVRVLLRNGIPYGTFAELAKWVYVDVASSELGIPGRKQTTSRIAVITGLSRKDVKQFRETEEPSDLGATERYNRAARVINGWLNDKCFTDDEGSPLDLPMEGDKLSFASLVKAHSGDIPSRAILDEMLRVGLVEIENDQVSLLAGGYIVRKGDADKISIMGNDVSELISTIDHNMLSDPNSAFLQRKVMYDNIPEEFLDELKPQLFDKSKKFINSINKIISSCDRDTNADIKGTGKKKAGIGIFYFE